MSTMPLFAFGTLRRGEDNQHVLAGRFDRLLPAMLKGYARGIARHGYPALIPDAQAEVSGELYFLTPALYARTLRDCDELEDIPEGAVAGEFYRRATVEVETAEGVITAWAYLAPDDSSQATNRSRNGA